MNYINVISPSKSNLSFLISTDPSLTAQGLNKLILLSFYSTYYPYYTVNHAFLYFLKKFLQLFLNVCSFIPQME